MNYPTAKRGDLSAQDFFAWQGRRPGRASAAKPQEGAGAADAQDVLVPRSPRTGESGRRTGRASAAKPRTGESGARDNFPGRKIMERRRRWPKAEAPGGGRVTQPNGKSLCRNITFRRRRRGKYSAPPPWPGRGRHRPPRGTPWRWFRRGGAPRRRRCSR